MNYGYPQSIIYENSDRVKNASKHLKDLGYKFIEPKPANESDLLKVHSEKYIESIKNGKFRNEDTPAWEGIYEFARLAAGGAILASEINGFSLMRPPGHHAGRNGIALGADSMGFSYFNNVAIAVRHLNKSTLIIDIDSHHGNGTQELFQNDDRVAYLSLHRDQYFPGTGEASTSNCLNYPLRKNCGHEVYLRTLDKALEDVSIFNFDNIAVSAGFDGHVRDLASLSLKKETYYEVGRRIADLGKPTFFVLEGGYSSTKLGKDIDSFLKGFERII